MMVLDIIIKVHPFYKKMMIPKSKEEFLVTTEQRKTLRKGNNH